MAIIIVIVWVGLSIITAIRYYTDIKEQREKSRWQYWLIIIFWPIVCVIAFIILLIKLIVIIFTGR